MVVHKPGKGVRDVGAAIRRGLPAATAAKVRTVTWGNHMATNDYADVPNVILAGTLFMRPSFYTALTHLARDASLVPGLAAVDAIERTVVGEHANLVLQAICRGRVRKSDGSKCQPMSAYVIATSHSGIPDSLPTIFPGATIKAWFQKRQKGKAAERQLSDAISYVRRRMREGANVINNSDIWAAVGIRRQHLHRIAKRREWWDEMEALGLVIYGTQKRMLGYQRRDVSSDDAD